MGSYYDRIADGNLFNVITYIREEPSSIEFLKAFDEHNV